MVCEVINSICDLAAGICAPLMQQLLYTVSVVSTGLRRQRTEQNYGIPYCQPISFYSAFPLPLPIYSVYRLSISL